MVQTEPTAQTASAPLAAQAAPRFWGLIPCAGVGVRAGSPGPKQYTVVAGQAMVAHTLRAFDAVERLSQTLVVLAPGDRDFAALELKFECCRALDCGGATRAASVYNGLQALRALGAVGHDWVLVHDAARCLILPEDIRGLMDACEHDEVGGLLALPLADTLKQATHDRVLATLSRAEKWLAQTPQMFRLGSLIDALELAGDAVTDESSAIEALGLQPRLVPGHAQNFKVTFPQDFELADLILRSRRSSPL